MRARIFAEENKKWWTLAAVAFGLFMIMLDNTIVNVALPSIEQDLHISISQLEWIVTGYALVVRSAAASRAASSPTCFGRRKIFIVGLVVFSLSSLACGFAPNAGFLIGARAVQGIGASASNTVTARLPRCSAFIPTSVSRSVRPSPAARAAPNDEPYSTSRRSRRCHQTRCGISCTSG